MNINKEFFNYKEKRNLPKFIKKDINDIKENNLNNTVIIVPFRDSEKGLGFRTSQLNSFIEYYHNFNKENENNVMNKEKYNNLKILIIEQSEDGKGFNRGALLNVGFDLSCLSEIKPDAFIFHDVDLISDKKLKPLYFIKPTHPIHIANLWKEKYNFYSFFGGIVSFNKEDYIKINGFPNTRFLWGGEDDIMLDRLATNKIDIIKPYSDEKNLIQELEPKIQTTLSKKDNEGKKLDILRDLKNWKKNGLNNLKYEVLKFENFKYENVFRILVHIHT